MGLALLFQNYSEADILMRCIHWVKKNYNKLLIFLTVSKALAIVDLMKGRTRDKGNP
jgi:hypothetical protein